MNNTIYIQLFDAVVNTYLMQHCGLRPTEGEQYGMVGASIVYKYHIKFPHLFVARAMF